MHGGGAGGILLKRLKESNAAFVKPPCRVLKRVFCKLYAATGIKLGGILIIVSRIDIIIIRRII